MWNSIGWARTPSTYRTCKNLSTFWSSEWPSWSWQCPRGSHWLSPSPWLILLERFDSLHIFFTELCIHVRDQCCMFKCSAKRIENMLFRWCTTIIWWGIWERVKRWAMRRVSARIRPAPWPRTEWLQLPFSLTVPAMCSFWFRQKYWENMSPLFKFCAA